MVVDLLGQSADMDAILELTSQYDVPVIEDAAEALGATYKDRAAGASGWASAFSFNGNKIITTSGGGMLCSNDHQLIERAKHWATQAKEPGPLYYHTELGYNYRLSNVLAAIGLAQLGRAGRTNCRPPPNLPVLSTGAGRPARHRLDAEGGLRRAELLAECDPD